MRYTYFISYNIVGGILWTALFTFTGFFFGNLEFIQKNFSLVVIAIVVISVLPMVYEYLKARREPKSCIRLAILINHRDTETQRRALRLTTNETNINE